MTSTRRLQLASSYVAPISPSNSVITHGDQITPANTGYTAYTDPALGRKLQQSDLAVVSGTHYISDFISPGGTITKKHFTGSIIININNVTLRGCLFDGVVSGYLNGNHATGWTLDYCSFIQPTPGDQCIQYQGYTANRCYLSGGSDGAKVNGAGTVLTECYIRTAQQSAQDHNDGLQNVGGDGPVTIKRCNINPGPLNNTAEKGNAALFLANGETGLHTIHDNLLIGGGYTVALYDTGTFDLQGNKFVRNSYSYDTHNVAGPGSGPQNITWGTIRPNTFSDNGQVISL